MKSCSRSASVLTVLVLALLAGGAPQTARAQAFPVKGTGLLDDLEREADRLVREQSERDARDAESRRQEEQAREKNAARWKEIKEFIDERMKAFEQATATRGFRELSDQLVARKEYGRMGRLFFRLAAWKNAERMFTACTRVDDQPEWTKPALEMLMRLELIESVERLSPERLESRLPRLIETSTAKLDRALDRLRGETGGRKPDTGVGDVHQWAETLPEALKVEQTLLDRLQSHPDDVDAIWSLIRLYRDRLEFAHRARAWLELLEEEFPEHDTVQSGEVTAGVIRLLAEQGLFEDAHRRLEEADEQVGNEPGANDDDEGRGRDDEDPEERMRRMRDEFRRRAQGGGDSDSDSDTDSDNGRGGSFGPDGPDAKPDPDDGDDADDSPREARRKLQERRRHISDAARVLRDRERELARPERPTPGRRMAGGFRGR